MIKWMRPSGTEIETNDNEATVKYAESLGWNRVGEEKPRRKRRTKVEIEAEKGADNGDSGSGS